MKIKFNPLSFKKTKLYLAAFTFTASVNGFAQFTKTSDVILPEGSCYADPESKVYLNSISLDPNDKNLFSQNIKKQIDIRQFKDSEIQNYYFCQLTCRLSNALHPIWITLSDHPSQFNNMDGFVCPGVRMEKVPIVGSLTALTTVIYPFSAYSKNIVELENYLSQIQYSLPIGIKLQLDEKMNIALKEMGKAFITSSSAEMIQAGEILIKIAEQPKDSDLLKKYVHLYRQSLKDNTVIKTNSSDFFVILSLKTHGKHILNGQIDDQINNPTPLYLNWITQNEDLKKKCKIQKLSQKDLEPLIQQVSATTPSGMNLKNLTIKLDPNCASAGDAYYDSDSTFQSKEQTLVISSRTPKDLIGMTIFHEYAHALFYENLLKSDFKYSKEAWISCSSKALTADCGKILSLSLPYTELYSDLFANIIKNDPNAMTNNILKKIDFSPTEEEQRNKALTVKSVNLRSFEKNCTEKQYNESIQDTYTSTCFQRGAVWNKTQELIKECGRDKALQISLNRLFAALEKTMSRTSMIQYFKVEQVKELNLDILNQYILQPVNCNL